MPIYNFQCPICENQEDRFVWPGFDWVPCSNCQGDMRKLFSFGQSQPLSEEAGWIRTVIEVVDKDSHDPVDKAFIKDPTRTNYKNWMRHHNLRPAENERGAPPTAKRPEIDRKRIVDYCIDQHRKRHRIEVKT